MRGPFNVLLIDDCEPVRDSLREYLTVCGWTARGAESADAAFGQLEAEPADVVVVDLRLPGLGGEGFIRQASLRWPKTRYLIFTGSADYEMARDLAANPSVVGEVLLKPLLDLNVLVQAIEKAMGEVR